MRVLMLSPLPPPAGGIATWTKKYLDQSPNYDIQVKVINEAHLGKNSKRIVRRVSVIEEIIRTTKILICTLVSVMTKKYSIVHINSSCGRGMIRDYCVARLGKLFGLHVILHCHCNVEDQLNVSRSVKSYFAKTMAVTDWVFVLNNKSYQRVLEFTNKVEILPNFIEDEYIAKKHSTSRSIESVFYCGRISRQKGADELFTSARMLPSVRYTLAGMLDTSYVATELPKNITLLGQIEEAEVKKYLDQSDVFIFPSYSEGFSIALLEAMARGIPCVVSDVGANRDMIENGGGIVLLSVTPEAIVEAVNALSSPDARKVVSEWNIEKVKRAYASAEVMAKIHEVYSRLIV